MRSFCTAKASHIFSTKNIGIFEILTFEILTLTNDVVSFEQPDPGQQSPSKMEILEDFIERGGMTKMAMSLPLKMYLFTKTSMLDIQIC